MSTTITLTGNSSVLKTNYFPPIELDGEYECSLVDFHMYNSIPNIDKYNNLFHIGGYVIEIPIGSFELEEISSYIYDEIKLRNILGDYSKLSIQSNNNTLQVDIFCAELNILFHKERSIGQVLGFTKKILKSGVKHSSNLPVNILKVNAIRLECNIITGSYVNKNQTHTLHEFALNVPPGYKMNEIPHNLIYLPVNTRVINTLKVELIDQDGDSIDLRGESVTLRIHLRKRL